MGLAGRHREMAEVGHVLDCAADGRGCVLAITGPPGSGRTELAAAAAREGARRGFTVLRTAAIPGQPGALAWARLLADAEAPAIWPRGCSAAPARWNWTAPPAC